MKVCYLLITALLFSVVNVVCSQNTTNSTDHHEEFNPDPARTWGFSFIGVTLGVLSIIVAPILTVFISKKTLDTINPWLICFGGGAVMGIVVADLLPHISEEVGIYWGTSGTILAGYFVALFITFGLKQEEECCESHNEGESENNDKDLENGGTENGSTNVTKHNTKHWSYLIIFGDAFCNFSDGLIISTAFATCSESLGWSITVAVVLHELPHEIGDYAIMIDSGMSKLKATLFNLLSGSFAYVGWVVGNLVNILAKSKEVNAYLISFGAGVLLLVITSVFPRAVKHKNMNIMRAKLGLIFLGMLIVVILSGFHGHCHAHEGEDHGDHH